MKDQIKISVKRKFISWTIRLFWIGILSPILVISGGVWFASMGWFGPLPSFEELENPKQNLATEIYASGGVLLGKFFPMDESKRTRPRRTTARKKVARRKMRKKQKSNLLFLVVVVSFNHPLSSNPFPKGRLDSLARLAAGQR